MSLRSKILILFVTLALGPLLAVGISDYLQSLRLVTMFVDAHLAVAGERAARSIGNRSVALTSDLRMLAEEYAVAGPGAAAEVLTRRPGWAERNRSFDKIEVRSAAGELLAILEDELGETGSCKREPLRFSVPIPGPPTGSGAHVLVGLVSVDRFLADGALVPPFGETGYTLLVDRASDRILYDPRCRPGEALAAFERQDGVLVRASALVGGSGKFAFRESDTTRTAWFVRLPDPPWMVVATTALEEFTAPGGRDRLASLIFVIFLAVATAGGFAIVVTHITRSLEDVSSAAARIGEGDFMPWLPPPGHDEVGKLTLAIGTMVARLKETVGQLERSRQLAVVGELASHLSHEIRNPLSSIRLNLQSVEREVLRGSVPADLPAVLQLCLREIKRLDGVVTNVLRLGRANPEAVRRLGMHALLDETLEVLQPQLAHRGVRLERRYHAAEDSVAADGERLSGALLNLYLNAADAMPQGGTLRVLTEDAHDRNGSPMIRVRIADEGAGVRPELRDQIFKPFFTTKHTGSGIGLTIALQTVESHGGRIYLERRSELEPGAEFVVEIPVESGFAERGPARNQWTRPTLREVSAPPVAAGAATGAAASPQLDPDEDRTPVGLEPD